MKCCVCKKEYEPEWEMEHEWLTPDGDGACSKKCADKWREEQDNFFNNILLNDKAYLDNIIRKGYGMEIPKRTRIMLDLGITENDCTVRRDIVIEKCFCAALLGTDTGTTSKVLSDYMTLRNELFPGEYST